MDRAIGAPSAATAVLPSAQGRPYIAGDRQHTTSFEVVAETNRDSTMLLSIRDSGMLGAKDVMDLS